METAPRMAVGDPVVRAWGWGWLCGWLAAPGGTVVWGGCLEGGKQLLQVGDEVAGMGRQWATDVVTAWP